MTFLSSIFVLNVSIILMMIIAFSNITFALQIYKLAELDNPDYENYLSLENTKYEKKLNVYEYFRSVHNLTFIKLRLSGEKTWNDRSNNIGKSCGLYKTVEYAVQEYYTNTFRNKIKNLTECTKDENENIFKIVNSRLFGGDPHEEPPSGIVNKVKKSFKSNNQLKLEKKIRVIDNALNSKPRSINKFYRCFQIFKNAVFNMQIEKANYPKETTEININGDKELSKGEKKKILTLEDVSFLSAYRLYDDEKFHSIWLKRYTGFDPTEIEGSYRSYNNCLNELHNSRDREWVFKKTQLSYQYIYPSQSKSLISYLNKRQIIIKYLKLLEFHLHKNDKIKEMYRYLEEGNYRVDQEYYDLMRNCRALSGEDDYEVYVMRLINTGCRPLGEPEWKIELKDTGKTNAVAKLQVKMK